MRTMSLFNRGWVFHAASGSQTVTLPHNAVELPYDYLDEMSYQQSFRYSHQITPETAWQDKEITLVFDGVMADAKVQVNGIDIASHPDGYTPFEVRLTDLLQVGENAISISLNGVENPRIPPFGGQIDYLTYAGIYRDVWLRVTDAISLKNMKIETQQVLSDQPTVSVTFNLHSPKNHLSTGVVKVVLKDSQGKVLASSDCPIDQQNNQPLQLSLTPLEPVTLWCPETPVLYQLALLLEMEEGSTDYVVQQFGFREACFKADGFFLNGERRVLIGLNRHQSFPYHGYALGRAAQERDAEILRYELGCNVVRTAHYPQSPWFLDHCDRIGLLVVEELPGWQHIGDTAWQQASVNNVEAMIRRDWNHPAIILWGVRINESADHHDFYTRTNALARALDPSRQTGGIRCIPNSELLEDVYTMNDFILGEEILPDNDRPRTPARGQCEVTGLQHPVPYLITEHTGHMYPTKLGDGEERQIEHVMRHLEVLNAVHGDKQIAGAIGWCFADYNTHKDFGSGDRICHHGVLDMFREPKFAAYVYASQMNPQDKIVFEPVTYWTRGDRAIGGCIPLLVLTNCDRMAIRFGDHEASYLTPARDQFPHLPHPPIIVERKDFNVEQQSEWGMAWDDAELIGYWQNEVVVTRRFVANPLPTRLEVVADKSVLVADGQDCTRIMLRALDQVGNRLPFLHSYARITLQGAAHLLTPSEVVFRGGAAGFWVRAGHEVGGVSLTITAPRFAPVTYALEVVAK